MALLYANIADDDVLVVVTDDGTTKHQVGAKGPKGLFYVLRQWAATCHDRGYYDRLDPKADPKRTVRFMERKLTEAEGRAADTDAELADLLAAGKTSVDKEVRRLTARRDGYDAAATRWRNHIVNRKQDGDIWEALTRVVEGSVEFGDPVDVTGVPEKTYGEFLYQFVLGPGRFFRTWVDVSALDIIEG